MGNLTESGSSILTITGGTGAVNGAGTTIQVIKSDATHDGYLSTADWNIFNSKGSVAGSDTQVQFNQGSTFAADSLFNWDYTNHRLGIGLTSPVAALDITTTGGTLGPISDPGPITLSFDVTGGAYNAGGPGFPWTYDIYTFVTTGGTKIYSTAATLTINEAFAPTGPSTNQNDTVGGAYFSDGSVSFSYDIYAMYDGSTKGVPINSAFTDSNDSQQFNIDLSWSAPSGPDVPDDYLVHNLTNGQVVTTSGATSITDDGTWGAIIPVPGTMSFNVNISWTGVAGIDGYKLLMNHRADGNVQSAGTTFFNDDAVTGWFNTATVTPNTASAPTLNVTGAAIFNDDVTVGPTSGPLGGASTVFHTDGSITFNNGYASLDNAGDLLLQGLTVVNSVAFNGITGQILGLSGYASIEGGNILLSNTGITLANAYDIIVGTTTGTKIGTSTSQKLAFYNSTPIVQPSGNIITALTNLGLVASPVLPNPSSSVLGGIQSAAAVTDQWINSISTSGVPALSQPAFTNISGSVAASQLPNPSSTTLGGVRSIAAVSHQWINTISTSGIPALTQPAFTDISGSVAASQLPNPSASTLGGIQSIAASSTKFISSISTSGVPALTQPAFTDISGSATAAQLPASVPIVQSSNRATAQTGAKTLTAFTVGGADASFLVSANILITTSTLHSFSVTCSYTDESNTARVLTLNFSQLTGAFVTTLTNALGASAYEGVQVHIRAKASTTITIQSTGTFTTVTYNIEQSILELN